MPSPGTPTPPEASSLSPSMTLLNELPTTQGATLAERTPGRLPRMLSFLQWKLAKKWYSWLIGTVKLATAPIKFLFMILGLVYSYRLEKLEGDAKSAQRELLQFAIHKSVTDGLEFIHDLEGYDVDSIPGGLVAYRRFSRRWERLVDDIISEWKTMNVVSALLVGGILTIFQIDQGANTATKRWSAILALICAICSILVGCIFIIALSSVRRPMLGIAWVLDNPGDNWGTSIFDTWRIDAFLAMPGFWLVATLVSFAIWMMLFVPPAGKTEVLSEGSPLATVYRILWACFLSIPVVASVFSIMMKFRGYGKKVDIAAGKMIQDALDEGHHLPSLP